MTQKTMTSRAFISGYIGGCIVLLCGTILSSLQAAEIRLKNIPIQCSHPLVTLADIADVLPMDAESENVVSLRQTVLFPAPLEGETRTIDQWQLRSILSQLGVNALHHYMSGAEKITITSTAFPNHSPRFSPPENLTEPFVIVQANYVQANDLTHQNRQAASESASTIPVRSDLTPKTVSTEMTKTLKEQVIQALRIYLNFATQTVRSWDISLRLSPDQVKLFGTNGQIVEITGGQMPYTGTQQFQIRMESGLVVNIQGKVALPTEIVVLRWTRPKGYILGESDVMLQQVEKIKGDDFITDIQSVIGKEIVKTVRELTPLSPADIRLPLWVRKGEIITVRAQSGGVMVSTSATALQDGVEGDTISVARIDLSAPKKRGKKEAPETYLARVSAPKTVEVFVK